MEHIDYFKTRVWFDFCNGIDNKNLKKQILNLPKKEKSIIVSNVGGYQINAEFPMKWQQTILNKIPLREDKPIPNFKMSSWVNINKNGHFNKKHNHLPDPEKHHENDVFLSGVYYVFVPENSGDIRFYDPRVLYIFGRPDYQYYYDDVKYCSIQPKQSMVIFFPPWLLHDVGANMSNENRISIGFNIIIDKPVITPNSNNYKINFFYS
jgi:hypothetical protein